MPSIQADEQVIGLEVVGQELVPIGAPGGKGKGGSATSSPPASLFLRHRREIPLRQPRMLLANFEVPDP